MQQSWFYCVRLPTNNCWKHSSVHVNVVIYVKIVDSQQLGFELLEEMKPPRISRSRVTQLTRQSRGTITFKLSNGSSWIWAIAIAHKLQTVFIFDAFVCKCCMIWILSTNNTVCKFLWDLLVISGIDGHPWALIIHQHCLDRKLSPFACCHEQGFEAHTKSESELTR